VGRGALSHSIPDLGKQAYSDWLWLADQYALVMEDSSSK